jgi:hypothetical protein
VVRFVRACTLSLVALGAALLPLPAGATGTGGLSVEGTQVLQGGSPVILRGLHRDGTQGGPGSSPKTVTAEELGWIGHAYTQSWHAGIVRIPVGAAQWTGACPSLATGAEAYQAQVDAEITTLTDEGVVALLDLHSSTAGCTSIDRHAMPDAPVVTSFWQSAATRYKANPLVAFELYNEPHFVTDDVWLNGTAGATQQDCDLTVPPSPDLLTKVQQQLALLRCQLSAPKYQAVGMQALYDLVTAAAPGHLVVVDAPGYAASVPSVRLKGSPVYGLHPYTCSVPGAACDTASQAHANLPLLDRWATFGKTAPVLVTELGWPVYSKGYGQGYVDGASYYSETLDYLKTQGWGWIAFAFDGTTGGGFSLVTDTTTYTPNSTGQVVYDALRAAS